MANSKEAKARIKINKLLEQAGWRFFDNEKGQANISLEPNVKLTQKDIDALARILNLQKTDLLIFYYLMKKVSRSLFWKPKKKIKIR